MSLTDGFTILLLYLGSGQPTASKDKLFVSSNISNINPQFVQPLELVFE